MEILYYLNYKKREKIFKKLKLRKINIVEKFNYKNLKNYSRITLAPSKEINKFIKILDLTNE